MFEGRLVFRYEVSDLFHRIDGSAGFLFFSMEAHSTNKRKRKT